MSQARHATKESVKETLISIIIAFVLAFVFRSFVIEAFIIPTGSMAPTLMGAHMRFTDRQTGSTWAVGPRDFGMPDGSGQAEPLALQGAPITGRGGVPIDRPMIVHEPYTGAERREANVPRRAGDRILVLKFLYMLQDPAPFDVVVFKNPGTPAVNYIKRLIGRPLEQVALVDGDIFVRDAALGVPSGPVDDPAAVWEQPGWTIRRKPARVEHAVWQPVYDTFYSPAEPGTMTDGFRQPWVGAGAGWTIDGAARSIGYDGSGPSRLEWDAAAPWIRQTTDPASGALLEPQRTREIGDRYPYNESTPGASMRATFPVSDVRLRANIELRPGADPAGARLAGVVVSRGHEFVGEISGQTARVKLRPVPTARTPEPAWIVLAEAPVGRLAVGEARRFEFWHADQRLSVWLDGAQIVSGQYDWSPAERIAFATGRPLREVLNGPTAAPANPLADPSIYSRPALRFEIAGGPCTLYRVGLDRDLYYQPAVRGGLPARATHPSTTITLGAGQYFVCGDNSPASEDGRLWRDPDPWVAEQIDETPGIVPRKLMLGKAFFVYFPALAGSSPIPMPDFGRMRFIQ